MRTLTLALLLMTVSLAGCFDGDDADAADDLDTSATTGNGSAAVTNGTVNGNVTMPGPGEGDGTSNASHDHLPHVHDYWDGRTRVLLANERVGMYVIGHYRFPADYELAGAWWAPPDPLLVYEGTGKLEVTTAWEDPTIQGLEMQYRHAGTRDYSEWMPLGNGETTVIDVTPQMTDLAHSGQSKWRLHVRPTGPGNWGSGEFHLKAEIVKVDDIMALPGHGDAYGDKASLTLMDGEGVSKNRAFYNDWTNCAVTACDEEEEGFTLPEGSTIPPGTKALTFEIQLRGTANGDYMDFWARDAKGDYADVEPLPLEEAGTYRFWMPVENGGADSPYATETLWRFFLQADHTSQDLQGWCTGCADSETQFHAVIKAWKEWDIMPEDDEDDDGDGR